MAPTKPESDDLKFIMTCTKHSLEKIKPNYEEVAKEIGAKSANACYHKHWGILRKWGLTGSKKGASAGASPAISGKKRKPVSVKTDATDSNPDEGSPPAKKRKAAGGRKKREVKEAADDDEAVSVKEEDGIRNDDAEDDEAECVNAED